MIMGHIFKVSGSSADKSASIFSKWKDGKEYVTVPQEWTPDPRPHNYILLRTTERNSWTIVELMYRDCKNYEGRKILVFNRSLEDVLKQKLIDPHFSENKNFISPKARFEPTAEGWAYAISFCENTTMK